MLSKIIECFIENLYSSPSCPTILVTAAAMAIDCGEIIFPSPPPARLAPNPNKPDEPIASNAVVCNFPNKALADVSEPVTKVPIQPIIDANRGNNAPLVATKYPIVVIIPELLPTYAYPNTEPITTKVHFNCLQEFKKTVHAVFRDTRNTKQEIIADNRIAVPAADNQLKLNSIGMA